MSANVAFPAGQGGANACSTTGSLGQNDWAHYNANNQMDPATKSYDQAGNMVGDNSTGNSYLYDGDGNRIAKGSLTSLSCNFSTNGFALQTSWVRNVGNQEGEWSGSASWMHTNVYDGSSLLATYSSANNDTYFALNDWLGTKRAEVAADGSCLSTFASLPYGDDLTPAGDCSDATEQHFTGKERDTESGNDYFGARYYASSMGRFMSPDSVGDDDYLTPIPYADLSNPQTLNLYGYAGNNPLSNVDPDGHDYVTVCASGSNQCQQYSPDQWAAIVAAQKQAGNGITVSGGGPDSTGTISCGGTACGSATFHETGMQDASGDLLMLAVPMERLAGPALGAIGKAISGLFGREAVDAAANAGAKAAVDVTNLSAKIAKQMGTRGWTAQEITETVENGTAHAVTNKATGAGGPVKIHEGGLNEQNLCRICALFIAFFAMSGRGRD